MPRVFLISIGTERSTVDNFRRTVLGGVAFAVIEHHAPDRITRLRSHAHSRGVPLWGMPKATWIRVQRAEPGDQFLFFWKGVCHACARLEGFFQDRQLACGLWPAAGLTTDQAAKFRFFAILSDAIFSALPLESLARVIPSLENWVQLTPRCLKKESEVRQVMALIEASRSALDPALDPFDDYNEHLVPPPRIPFAPQGQLELDEGLPDPDLGRRGEQWVLDQERARLRNSWRPELAEKVDWPAGRNETPGYDIASFDPVTFQPITIEVKTTAKDRTASFLLTANEKSHLDAHPETARIYRVFDFRPSSKIGLYMLTARSLALQSVTPSEYRVQPRE